LAALLFVGERPLDVRRRDEPLADEPREVVGERALHRVVVGARAPAVQPEAGDEARRQVGALAVPAVGPLRLDPPDDHRRLAVVSKAAFALGADVAPAGLDRRAIGAGEEAREGSLARIAAAGQ